MKGVLKGLPGGYYSPYTLTVMWEQEHITLDQAIRYFEAQPISEKWVLEFEKSLGFLKAPDLHYVCSRLRGSYEHCARLNIIITELPRLAKKMNEGDLKDLLNHFNTHVATGINSSIILAER